MRFPYLDAPVPLGFAHRGGAADGDENTVAAFERAVTLGFRYVETDVHTTSDGVPVVFHDPTLARVAGRPDRIDALTWADLTTVRVGGAAAVPRLADVLAAWPSIRFNIDVKSDAGTAPVVAAVRNAGALDRVLLASFSDTRLARIRALGGPELATGLGRRAVIRLRLASLAGLPVRPPASASPSPASASPSPASASPSPASALRFPASALRFPASAVAAQVPVRHGGLRVVDRRFLVTAHRAGLQVHVWTIDDPAEMNDLLDLGVDGIMTDRLDVLRDVYAARGLWPPR